MNERHVIDPSKELGIDFGNEPNGTQQPEGMEQMPPSDMPEPPMPMDDNEVPEDGMPEPPMDDEQKGETSEIDRIFDKLDTEKQAAVIKYAKSMVNDSDDNDIPDENDGPRDMTESKEGMDNLVNEIVNNILSDMETGDDEDRRDNIIRNKKITTSNPYISKR